MIFFDNNSTTPVAPEVLAEMQPWLSEKFASPASSGYRSAIEADARITLTRNKIADILGCFPEEIFFTSGATESINTVLRGFVTKRLHNQATIVSNKLEHSATLETIKFLRMNFVSNVAWLSHDSSGKINFDSSQVIPARSLLSLMWVNNELGNINSLQEIADFAKVHNLFTHIDAAQGIGKLPVNLSNLTIDSLSFSGHKIYAPKGIGILFLRKNFQKELVPLLTGGGQNFGFRSGTLNVPYIVGIGKALELMQERMEDDKKHITALRDRLGNSISILSDSFYINGQQNNRIYNTLNFGFRGIESNFWFKHLKDVAFSTGSACSTGQISHVLRELGVDEEITKSSIRMGFGRYNTIEEVDSVADNFKQLVKQ